MIGIYHDSFIDYLKQYISNVKVTSKNIIIPCLWCEQNQTKKHYHLYISLEAPIFHCFHNDCLKSGTISKLFEKLSGNDNSEKFFDKEKIKQIKKIDVKIINNDKNVIMPDLKEDLFKLKSKFEKIKIIKRLYQINRYLYKTSPKYFKMERYR